MDLTSFQHAETVTVGAAPDAVYALVADLPRMGEWSPVCTGGAWEDESKAWFKGRNQINDFVWETRCRIDEAVPGKAFSFVNCGSKGDVELVRWGFTFTPVDAGTEVTESWEVLPDYETFVRSSSAEATDADVAARIDGMRGMAQTGISETLAKLKATVDA